MHRFYAEGELSPEGLAKLSEEDVRHAQRVLRMQAGDALELFAGGRRYAAVLLADDAEGLRCRVSAELPSTEAKLRVTLYQGLPKADKMEWIVQKAVELGAVAVTPFFSRFCVAAPKKEEQKNARYARIAAEAAKQCGRGILPRVGMPLTFAQLCGALPAYDAALLCYEGGGAPLRALAARLPRGARVALITGAEGGFAPDEARALQQAGAAAIGLGPRILRCETAPLAALAALMAFTGNLE